MRFFAAFHVIRRHPVRFGGSRSTVHRDVRTVCVRRQAPHPAPRRERDSASATRPRCARPAALPCRRRRVAPAADRHGLEGGVRHRYLSRRGGQLSAPGAGR